MVSTALFSLPLIVPSMNHASASAPSSRQISIQSIEIATQCRGDANVIVRRPGRQMRKAHAGQYAGAHPPRVALAVERNHRYAHPQGLAGGRVSAPRERIEGDVDLAIDIEVSLPGRQVAAQLQPLAADAASGEFCGEAPLDRPLQRIAIDKQP